MNTKHRTTGLSPSLFDQNPSAPAPLQVPLFRVELVREGTLTSPVLTTPQEVAALLGQLLGRADREHFIVVLLSARNQVIGINTASIGSLTAAIVSPREVFKPAILANASGIVLAHNHPSGSLEPSPQDITVTRQLAAAGKLLDIPVHDHLIIGFSGQYTSLAERGLMG